MRPQPAPPSGTPLTPPPGRPAGGSASSPAPGSAGEAPATQPAYRAKLAVQGRMLEIVTPRALAAGTEVRLTREASGQLQVAIPRASTAPGQTPPPSGQAQASAPVPPSPASAQPSRAAAGTPARAAMDTALLRIQIPLPRNQPDPGLRAGEAVNARVVRVSAEPAPGRGDPAGYRTQLALPGRTLELTLPRPLPLDTPVKLRLDPGGTLTLELPSPRAQAVEQTLRQHLPQQQPPHLLLNLLGEAQQGGQLQRAQPLLLNLVQLLLGRSLTPQKADGEGVRQQLLNGGTQLENRLARGDTQALQQDHKALLLRFNQALQAGGRELPPALGERLTQMTREAISRVLVNQVTSLGRQSAEPGSEAGRSSLALDIPVFWQGQNENIKLRIERDPQRETGDEPTTRARWQVRLQFAIAELPPLGVELTLEGERISVLWQGEQAQGLRRLLGPRLEELQERLETLGLEVGAIGIREGSPKKNARDHRPPLIDIKT